MLRKLKRPFALLEREKNLTYVNVGTPPVQGWPTMVPDHDRYSVSPGKALIELHGSISPGQSPKVHARQLNMIQRQARRLDNWGLLIGLVPVCVLLRLFHCLLSY